MNHPHDDLEQPMDTDDYEIELARQDADRRECREMLDLSIDDDEGNDKCPSA